MSCFLVLSKMKAGQNRIQNEDEDKGNSPSPCRVGFCPPALVYPRHTIRVASKKAFGCSQCRYGKWSWRYAVRQIEGFDSRWGMCRWRMELRLSFGLAFHVSDDCLFLHMLDSPRILELFGTLVSGHPRLMRPFGAICPLLADCDSLFFAAQRKRGAAYPGRCTRPKKVTCKDFIGHLDSFHVESRNLSSAGASFWV